MTDVSLVDRFWAKVERDRDTGCWLWTAAIFKATGYGAIRWDGKVTTAHSVSFLLSGRTKPHGWHIDHTCRRRACVKPDHLRAVPPFLNALNSDTTNAAKRRCRRGHDLAGENIYRRPSTGHRECRECHRINDAKRPSGWARQRAAGRR